MELREMAPPLLLEMSSASSAPCGLQENPPTLVLGLFARPPFLCFGSVRLGSSHAALLAIENPNSEPTCLQCERVPEARGFSLDQHSVLLQPMERIFVTVRWTPLEEGGVRELITFVSNNIVKHRVILLGKAYQPAKKKKSLWETIKKKSNSAPSNSVRQKKKDFNVKTVNKTFHVPQRTACDGTERVRSPLQSCENVVLAEGNASPPKSSRQNVENRKPLSPLKPLRIVPHDATCAPGSPRSSTTYSALCTDTYCKSWQEAAPSSSDQNTCLFVDKEAASASDVENGFPLSPIMPVIGEHHDVTCTPSSTRRSTIYSVLGAYGYRESFQETTTTTIVQADHFSPDKTLSPHAFVNASVLERSMNKTPETRILNRMHSPVCTPDDPPLFLTPFSQRRFLSPDSFVNDSYQPDEDVESAQIVTVLSPDQFVKENLSAINSAVDWKEYESLLLSSRSSSMNVDPSLHVTSSSSKNPPLIQKESETLPFVSGCVEHDFENSSSEELEPVPSGLTFYVEPKQACLRLPEINIEISSELESDQPKRSPVLSATVTKCKADAGDAKTDKARIPPKSRRCLKSAITHGDNVALDRLKVVRFQDLPVIDFVSCNADVQEAGLASSDQLGSTLVGRKRKSDEYLQMANVATNERVINAKINETIAPSVKAKKASIPSGNVSRYKTDRQNQRKKAASMALKSSVKTHNFVDASKSKFTFTKSLQIDSPFQKSTSKCTKRVVAVPQSHLTFVKPAKTAIPRHPMPFAAKNMFYDERWKEKQERGFTWWLNFILTPDDLKTISSRVNAAAIILGAENHKASVPKAPSKEEMSLKAYTARRQMNRLRRAACRLFTSDSVVKAIKRLELEIEAKRLLVRKDRHLWKDIGEREKVLHWLLSYNPLWLRIGLETIYGELISLESNSDVMGLALFVLNRLLWNPDLAEDYRHPTVPHLYRDGHEEALSKFTLKKLLLLVYFLDHAKQSRLIDHDPCLFCKDSDFKASKDVLLAFSRNFLSGEGDLSRHLGYLGLPVSHVQTPLDEFDFAVTNLAVDLQCGVRLVRAMELLAQNWTLSKKLRVPAISRLQKMHNVEVALSVLKERDIQLKDEHGTTIDSRDIVDRHRERTLALLWRIVSAFQVDVLLNVGELKEEIKFLKQSWNLQKKRAALQLDSKLPNVKRSSSGNFSSLKYCENVTLLMEWVNATCAFQNIKVDNFTVSFSDGRVLCYLIHHYHPCYIPLSEISQHTTQTVECTQTGTIGLNYSSESDNSLDTWPITFDQTITTSVMYKELLENERKNFHLMNAAVANLGGIPAMINHSDMSNTIPDEKVVITYLSFLCARLLDLRKETRAARAIQTAWRKYKLKAELELIQKRDQAARKIQAVVARFLLRCRFKRQVSAVVVLQKHWKRYLAQKQAREFKLEKLRRIQYNAATLIQAQWRQYSARRYYLQLRYCTILMQARIRTKIAITAYERLACATLTIQRYVRAWLLAKQERLRYRTLKSSSLVIQAAFRRWKCGTLLKQTKAAVVLQAAFRKWHAKKVADMGKGAVQIQSWYRMHENRRRYRQIRQSAIKIQACFRCIQAKRAYQAKKRHITTLQKYYRAFRQGRAEKEKYLQKRTAVLCLQTAFREMKARQLDRQVKAVCLLQSLWRMRKERLRFLHVKRCLILLQSHIRKWQQLCRYRKMRHAASVIQARYRAHSATKQAVLVYRRSYSAVVLQTAYRRMKSRKEARKVKSAVTIQAYYRAYITRKRFQKVKCAVVRIQALVKARQAQARYSALKKAALCIQRHYRSNKCMLQHKEEYQRLREACIQVQAVTRGHLIRKQMQLWKKSATTLQAQYRMKRERLCYLKLQSAVIAIQKYYSAYRVQVHQRKKFLKVKKSAICIQATYRGYRVRKALELQVAAALKIQAVFRMYSARKKYLGILKACITIQRFSRACQTGRQVRLNFLKTREVVVCLQAAYHGWVVRSQIQKQHKAAVLLQAYFRMIMYKKHFRWLKHAALTIQQHYKARIACKDQRQKYCALKHSVTKLQAAWRGAVLRKQLERQWRAAVVIQSYYRMHAYVEKFRAVRHAATVIQNYFRAHSSVKKQRSLYLKSKAAAVVLQATWRGRKVRKHIRKLNGAAATIQAAYKSYSLRKKYVALRAATVTVQRRYRTAVQASNQRQEYLELRKAAIKLQAVCRGKRARRQMQHMQQAATTIQTVVRGHQLRVSYCKLKISATVIQRRYRALRQGRTDRGKYLELKRSTVTLQAACRGMAVRLELKCLHQAAVRIQTSFRMYRQRGYYRRVIMATKTLQLRYRACKDRDVQAHKYRTLKNAALCIQSAYRGLQTRRCMQVRHAAATVIQRRFKSYLERQQFISLKKVSIAIQQKYHLKKLGKRHRSEYLRLRAAATTVQAAYRGLKVRKNVQLRHKAASVIQAMFRTHKLCVAYRAMKMASVTIQQHYRAHRMANLEREHFLKQRHSAVVLQAAYRGKATRLCLKRMHRAASHIQANYRMCIHRRHYRRLQWATKVIQQRVRANQLRHIAVQRYSAMKAATCCIQASFRGAKLRMQLREMHTAASVIQRGFKARLERRKFIELRSASLVIQRRYRELILARHQRREYHSLRKAVTFLQAAYRGLKVRREIREMHRAATTIQSVFRMHRVCAPYQAMKTAVVIIQNSYRACIKCQIQREKYLALRESAVVIQAAYRGLKDRQRVKAMHAAATVIQSLYRMYRQRVYYMRVIWAVTTLQQRYRAKSSRDAQLQRYVEMRKATLIIQATFRGMKLRKQINEMNSSAVVIQRLFKTLTERKRYLTLLAITINLQRKYRASIAAREQLKKYGALRRPVIHAQSAYRGLRVRRMVHHMHQAATTIQSAFRMHTVRVQYQAMKIAASIIQKSFRAYANGKTQRAEYLALRESAVVIQAAYRDMKDRQRVEALHAAATVIQSHYRMHRQRACYKTLLWAVTTLQQRYRANRARDAQVLRYMKVQKANLCFQAAFRGVKLRKQLCEMNSAAAVIQRQFRAVNEQKQYLSLRAATVAIQRKYRASLLAREQLKKYSSLRRTVIHLQAAYRGLKVRRMVHRMHQAATTIQSAFRMHRVRVPYQAMKISASIIQIYYRACIAGRKRRDQYLTLQKSAIVVQSAYRGMKCRRNVEAMHAAATVIQSYYRMYRLQDYYKRICWSVTTVQQRYRAKGARDSEMQRYVQMRKATICIQAGIRGMKLRKQVKGMHKAAIVIQRCFKTYSEHKRYLMLRAAVIVCQQRYRASFIARQQHQEYLCLRKAAVHIQSAYRAFRVRQEVQQMHLAATTIQSAFRMHRARMQYQAKKTACSTIQTFNRSYIVGRCEREKYLAMCKSAVLIQAVYRGLKTRRNLKIQHTAATVLQSQYRMHKQRACYRRMCWAVGIIQQRYQAKQARDVELHQYRLIKKTVLCIQAAFRVQKARQLVKEMQAARRIQSVLQMYTARKRFLVKRSAAVVIQASFRGYSTRAQCKVMTVSATVIQRWYRSCQMAQVKREEYHFLKKSAVVIQSAFRGLLARRLSREKRAARKIQSYLHMTLHRRKFNQLRNSAVTLQAYYRMYKAQQQYGRCRKAVVVLQTQYRAHLAMKCQRELFLHTLRNIITVQAAMRRFIERKRLLKMKSSTIKIQALWRGYIQRTTFLEYKYSALKIQMHFRAHSARRVEQQKYRKMKISAIAIQALYRGFQARHLTCKMRAAQKIQTYYRGYRARKEYRIMLSAIQVIQNCVQTKLQRTRFLEMRDAAVCIQKRWRETCTTRTMHHKFLTMKTAAIKIQSVYRGYCARRQLSKQKQENRLLRFTAAAYHHMCALKIQRNYKVHLALERAKNQINMVVFIQRWFRSRLQHKKYLEDRLKIVRLQRAVRTWLNLRNESACVIQKLARQFIFKKRKQKIMKGVIHFQALWRGYFWRTRHDTPRIKALRTRLVEATEVRKEENILCNRTSIAIEYLLKYKHISYILAALKHLEVATRLSSLCCENMAQSGAIKTIFILIRSCNRSIPCMEVIKYSVQVLLNLSKYEKTRKAVYDVEKSVDTLTELMQMYREKPGDKVADKGGSIFTKACCLLGILSLDSKRALEIRAVPKAVDRICSIYKLTARKHKIDAQRTVCQQRMNISLNGGTFSRNASFNIQATPIRTRIVSRIKPDWILRKDNIKEIEDPLKAIEMVMDTLSIAR